MKTRTSLSIGAALCFAIWASGDGLDVLASFRSPETDAGVRQIASFGPIERVTIDPRTRVTRVAGSAAHVMQLASDPVTTSHDFDGDGVADLLASEYFHQEPLFHRSTSGMVLVRSGRTGAVLFGRATLCPLTGACWCGDADGNGTDDVLLGDDGRALAFGWERPSSR